MAPEHLNALPLGSLLQVPLGLLSERFEVERT